MAEENTRPSALPDFCSLDALFSIVVTGELLAFILVLRPGAGTVDEFVTLLMAISMSAAHSARTTGTFVREGIVCRD